MRKDITAPAVIWADRKRIFFGLPWSFTSYRLEEEKLIIEKGFLNSTEDEIRLYRIIDLTLTRSFWERICGLGTVHCCSADHTSPEFDLLHIKNPRDVKNRLSEMVEEARIKRGIGIRENVEGEETPDESEAHETN